MFRYESGIGRRLRAGTLPDQKTAARIACSVLKRMTKPGIPVPQGAT